MTDTPWLKEPYRAVNSSMGLQVLASEPNQTSLPPDARSLTTIYVIRPVDGDVSGEVELDGSPHGERSCRRALSAPFA
jgi:hypothetical protein